MNTRNVLFGLCALASALGGMSASHAITLNDVPRTGPIVTGSAAIHEHVMAEYAFSGKWHWGSVEGAENYALDNCTGDGDTHGGAFGICLDPVYLFMPNAAGRDTCCHSGGLFDCYDKRTDGKVGDPYWDYLEWPLWDTVAHPRYWWGHLRKARDAGMKLMLVLAVENNALCAFTSNETWKGNPYRGAGYACDHGDSFNSVKRQIDNLKVFAQTHADFLEIAYTPADARRIANAGKMALVIGVESDYAWGNERTPIDLKARLNAYHALGARHVYLTHSLNTRLAGAGLYVDTLWAQQSVANCFFKDRQCANADGAVPADAGHNYEVKQSFLCFGWPGYAQNYYFVCEYTMSRAADPALWDGFKAYPGGGVYTTTETTYSGGSVSVKKNALGLTADGDLIVKEMMKKGMLIELSHLSERSIDAIYAISQAKYNYPLMSSHSYARRALHADKSQATGAYAGWEATLSDSTIARIKTTEGIVGHFMGPDTAPTYSPSNVANNCPRSSRSLAQLISYMANQGVNVAWAGDFMGLGAGVAPRRGYTVDSNDWCQGNTTSQNAQGSAYNAHLNAYTTEFDKDRAYYYTRGYAHHGLIEHLHNDLTAIGLPASTLKKFKDDSAENFIRMWEKAEYIASHYTL